MVVSQLARKGRTIHLDPRQTTRGTLFEDHFQVMVGHFPRIVLVGVLEGKISHFLLQLCVLGHR